MQHHTCYVALIYLVHVPGYIKYHLPGATVKVKLIGDIWTVNLFGLVPKLLKLRWCDWVLISVVEFLTWEGCTGLSFNFCLLCTQWHWKYINILYHLRSPIQNFIKCYIFISWFAFIQNILLPCINKSPLILLEMILVTGQWPVW